MKAILLGMAVIMTAICSANAKSELLDAQILPIWPKAGAAPNLVSYDVQITRKGAGLLEVNFATLGLATGSVVKFSPSMLRFTGNSPETLITTITIDTSTPAPTDKNFKITATARDAVVEVHMIWPDNVGGTPVSQPTLSIVQTGPDAVQVRGLGTGLAAYDIQSATDLNATDGWTLRGTSSADVNGRFTFDDTMSAGTPARFYRSAQPVIGGTTTPVSN